MTCSQRLLVGIGSPWGDDRLGWLVAERLAARARKAGVYVRRATAPIDLLDWLRDVDRLFVCDACRGFGTAGQIGRWEWPTPDLPGMDWSGTHDLSLPLVLMLGQRLGYLPQDVVVWGMEGGEVEEGAELSSGVARAIPRLVERIAREL